MVDFITRKLLSLNKISTPYGTDRLSKKDDPWIPWYKYLMPLKQVWPYFDPNKTGYDDDYVPKKKMKEKQPYSSRSYDEDEPASLYQAPTNYPEPSQLDPDLQEMLADINEASRQRRLRESQSYQGEFGPIPQFLPFDTPGIVEIPRVETQQQHQRRLNPLVFEENEIPDPPPRPETEKTERSRNKRRRPRAKSVGGRFNNPLINIQLAKLYRQRQIPGFRAKSAHYEPKEEPKQRRRSLSSAATPEHLLVSVPAFKTKQPLSDEPEHVQHLIPDIFKSKSIGLTPDTPLRSKRQSVQPLPEYQWPIPFSRRTQPRAYNEGSFTRTEGPYVPRAFSVIARPSRVNPPVIPQPKAQPRALKQGTFTLTPGPQRPSPYDVQAQLTYPQGSYTRTEGPDRPPPFDIHIQSLSVQPIRSTGDWTMDVGLTGQSRITRAGERRRTVYKQPTRRPTQKYSLPPIDVPVMIPLIPRGSYSHILQPAVKRNVTPISLPTVDPNFLQTTFGNTPSPQPLPAPEVFYSQPMKLDKPPLIPKQITPYGKLSSNLGVAKRLRDKEQERELDQPLSPKPYRNITIEGALPTPIFLKPTKPAPKPKPRPKKLGPYRSISIGSSPSQEEINARNRRIEERLSITSPDPDEVARLERVERRLSITSPPKPPKLKRTSSATQMPLTPKDKAFFQRTSRYWNRPTGLKRRTSEGKSKTKSRKKKKK